MADEELRGPSGSKGAKTSRTNSDEAVDAFKADEIEMGLDDNDIPFDNEVSLALKNEMASKLTALADKGASGQIGKSAKKKDGDECANKTKSQPTGEESQAQTSAVSEAEKAKEEEDDSDWEDTDTTNSNTGSECDSDGSETYVGDMATLTYNNLFRHAYTETTSLGMPFYDGHTKMEYLKMRKQRMKKKQSQKNVTEEFQVDGDDADYDVDQVLADLGEIKTAKTKKKKNKSKTPSPVVDEEEQLKKNECQDRCKSSGESESSPEQECQDDAHAAQGDSTEKLEKAPSNEEDTRVDNDDVTDNDEEQDQKKKREDIAVNMGNAVAAGVSEEGSADKTTNDGSSDVASKMKIEAVADGILNLDDYSDYDDEEGASSFESSSDHDEADEVISHEDRLKEIEKLKQEVYESELREKEMVRNLKIVKKERDEYAKKIDDLKSVMKRNQEAITNLNREMNDERENAQRLLESYAILQRQNQDKTVEIERLKDEVQRRKLVNQRESETLSGAEQQRYSAVANFFGHHMLPESRSLTETLQKNNSSELDYSAILAELGKNSAPAPVGRGASGMPPPSRPQASASASSTKTKSKAKSSQVLEQIIKAVSQSYPHASHDEILKQFSVIKKSDDNWKKLSINQIVNRICEVVAANEPVSDCSICLGPLSNPTNVRRLDPCGHKFHYHCISTWFQENRNCPNCRNHVVPIEDYPALK